MEEIRNKVAESGLITINLEQYYPDHQPLPVDLKNFLFMEMLLKEKDFREALDQHDWSQYENRDVAVFCSTDAIVPMWAYMLVVSKLSSVEFLAPGTVLPTVEITKAILIIIALVIQIQGR